MSKIVLINDIHFGGRNDAEFLRKHQRKFFEEVFFPYLDNNKIMRIICNGDVNDRRKYINFETLQFEHDVLWKPLEQRNIEVDIIDGNHDLAMKSTNRISSINLLLSQYKNIKHHREPTIKDIDGCKFMMCGWFYNQEMYEKSMKFIADNDADVFIGHLELMGFPLQGENTMHEGQDPKFFEKFPCVLSGHYHTKSTRGNIHYLGTQYEIIASDTDGHKKGFHVFDTETKTLEFVPNPYTLFEKITYDDSNPEFLKYLKNIDYSKFTDKIVKITVLHKQDNDLYEKMLDNLYSQSTIEISIFEDISCFHQDNVDVSSINLSTKELIDQYVDTVDTPADKKKIKNMIGKIYIESLMNNAK